MSFRIVYVHKHFNKWDLTIKWSVAALYPFHFCYMHIIGVWDTEMIMIFLQ